MNSKNLEIFDKNKTNKLFLKINQQAFTELLTFIDFADDKLNISFVEINFARDRDVLIEALIQHQDCQNIQFEILNFPDPNLRFLRDELLAALKQIKIAPDKKLILLITGLEKSIGILEEYPSVLVNLNFVRDDLRITVPYPMLLFLPDYALTRLAKYAPDFWAWGRKVFYFKTAKTTLVQTIENTIFSNRSINSLELSEKKERIDLLLRLLSEYSPSDKQNLPTIINIYNELGVAFRTLEDYQKAINYHQQSLEITKQIYDRQGKATSLIGLGTAYYFLGDYQKAINYHQQSLEITKQIDDRHGEAISLGNLGNVYYAQGEYQRAIKFHKQSLKIEQAIGDRQGEAISLGNLGNAYYAQGEYQRAIEFYKQSLKIKQAIGDQRGKAISLGNLGNVYYAQGEYQRAIEFHKQSLAIKQSIGDRRGEADSLIGLGNAYYALGEYQGAIDYLQQSLEIQQQIGDRHGKAESWFNLGDSRKNLEQKSEAKTAYENSRKLYQEMGLDHKVEECDKAIQSLEEG